MARFPSYDRGDWDAICDSCGRKFKASELKKRWDGLMVCRDDYEQRQPQDFVRARIDIQAVPWSRPEASDTFSVACTSNTAMPGYAQPGCMVPGLAIDIGSVPLGSFTP